ALACGFLFWWIGRLAGAVAWERAELVSAAFANIAIAQTLINGNYGILVVALLAGCFLLDQSRRPVSAGLLMGLAMTKPTIAGPFWVVLLVRRRWAALFASTAYLLAAWMAASYWVHTPPGEFLGQMFRSPDRFTGAFGGYGAWQALARVGLTRQAALL